MDIIMLFLYELQIKKLYLIKCYSTKYFFIPLQFDLKISKLYLLIQIPPTLWDQFLFLPLS